MFEQLPGLAYVLAIVALTPGVLLWRRRGALTHFLEDPAFAERFERERRRSSSLTVVAFAILVVASPGAMTWTIPLLLVGHVTAAYPLRKVLYGETWTLRAYWSFVGRVGFGVWGFWLSLALLPHLVSRIPRYEWVGAFAGAAALLIWNSRGDTLLRRVLRTRPIDDAALLERFTAVARRSRVAMPRFESIPLAGGAVSNALALPALPRSSVLFTETLLAQLDADEATAICAHEIAHLEHHTPRYLRRLHAVNIAMVLTAAAIGVMPRIAGWGTSLLPSVVWLLVLAGVAGWRVRGRQKHETASDVRAVALCGDPDALVRALTKLYTFARMPRRVAADVDRQATHPSLARRIRDIRTAAGSTPAALGGTSSFAAADGRTAVTFDIDRLHWSDGDVATHSVSYGYLSELRLQVGSTGATSLVAVERGGRKWHIALAAPDVARLQAVLDVVDGRLADPVGPPATFARVTRLMAGSAAAVAVVLGQVGLAVAALMALLQPSAPLLAGAGVGALAAATMVVRTWPGLAMNTRVALTAMLVLLGAALLGGAYSRRSDDVPAHTMIGVVVLIICAVFWSGLLAMNGLHPVDLHLAAQSLPSAAVFLLGSSATLACLRSRAARCAAAPLALAGVTVLTAGSAWFVDRFGRDPLIGPTQPLTWTTVSGPPAQEATVPFFASSMELSAEGDALIVTKADDYDGLPEFHVGRPGGPLVRIEARDVVFAANGTVLAVDDTREGAEIRSLSIDNPDRVGWRWRVSGMSNATLRYVPSAGTWRLVGVDEDNGLMLVEGTPGLDAVREVRWAQLGAGAEPDATAVAGDAALVVEPRYDGSLLQRSGWWRLALLLPGRGIESHITRITRGERTVIAVTRLDVQCTAAARQGDRMICSGFDGTRTRFAVLDAATGSVTPAAWLPGRVAWLTTSADGWLSGWTAGHAVAIRPATAEAIRLRSGPDRVTLLTVTNRMLAAVSFRDGTSTIRVYELEEARHAAR